MLLRLATFVPHSPAIHQQCWLWRRHPGLGSIAEKAASDLRAVITKPVMPIGGLGVQR
jgi:hypothetical protein